MARRQKGPKVKYVRKRNGWTRAYAKRTRPKTPAPKDGWVLAELAALTGLPDTTVRYYVNERLLRPMEFRGTVTRYPRRDLMRLVGIQRLKAEGTGTLKEIKRQFDAMSDEELASWLRTGPIPAAAATALGIEPKPSPNAANQAVRGDSRGTGRLETGSAAVEQWQRVVLLPGLELMLRLDAPEAIRLAAQRIVDEYVLK